MGRVSYKGRFSPKNPDKYRGNPDNIIFRSLWERKVMIYLDENSNVIEWASEEIIIPYVSPKDGLPHRYFPDFWVKALRNGQPTVMIWEVKPLAQTREPIKRKRNTQKYLTEMQTYQVNQAKFEAATRLCEKNGWEFKVITEQQLNV